MINPEEHGSSRPALKPDDLGKATVAVLTVLDAEELEIKQDGQDRKRLVVTFEEFPDKGYWCNVTAVKTLCGKLGNNEVKWPGQLVPLVKATTRNPSTKKMVDVLWVADGDEWDGLIADNSTARRAVRAPRAAATRETARETATRGTAKAKARKR